jgi:hypothetical protein
MSRFKDLTGKVFGKLIVLKRYDKVGTKSCAMWLCKCSCGNKKVIASRSLQYGSTRSCGCLQSSIVSKRQTKHNQARSDKVTSEYSAWRNMKARCNNKKHQGYR